MDPGIVAEDEMKNQSILDLGNTYYVERDDLQSIAEHVNPSI